MRLAGGRGSELAPAREIVPAPVQCQIGPAGWTPQLANQNAYAPTAPPVYRPEPPRIVQPQIYRPHSSGIQPRKSGPITQATIRIEKRLPPPVYRPTPVNTAQRARPGFSPLGPLTRVAPQSAQTQTRQLANTYAPPAFAKMTGPVRTSPMIARPPAPASAIDPPRSATNHTALQNMPRGARPTGNRIVQLMPVGTYVRYWDGRAVGYGRITGEGNTTYTLRVGGTDTEIEVGKGHVTYHPVLIAMGKASKKPLEVEDSKYLYHATASQNVPLIKQNGLKPRTMLSFKNLPLDMWKGAEVETGRTQLEDPLGSHYRAAQEAVETGAIKLMPSMLETLQFGDVGDFVYATPGKYTAAGYAMEVMRKGKQAVILRFKAGTTKWYQDPKDNAFMGMTVISKGAIEKHTVQTVATIDDLNDVYRKDAIQDAIVAEFNGLWEAL